MEWIEKVEITEKKKFLAMGETCMAAFWPTAGFKVRTSGFSTEGTFISASGLGLWVGGGEVRLQSCAVYR